MSSVDDRIVNMKFNNKDFTQGATETKRSLSDIESALQNTAKTKGLSNMGDQIQQVTGKFSAMRIAGVTAVGTIANKAVNAGLSFVKSFTLGPITDGFKEYQTNLNSIQTIIANTGKKLPVVTKYLNQLNAYSDQTIYNFGEMTRNIGTFTAAGVGLKQSVAAIKGISNLAALSGSNSQQASTAMYQLSQAIAAGRVNLQDWNSVVNAGMGGKQFQTALAQTAVAMGKLNKGALELDKNNKLVKISGEAFRQSISPKPGKEPWLDAKVLVGTLAALDGRFSDAAIAAKKNENGTQKYATAAARAAVIDAERIKLAKQGTVYSDKQFKQLTEMADAAYNSATQIKTLPQLLGVVRESLGSIWATVFSGILGDFEQSVTLWTKAGNAIGKVTQDLNFKLAALANGWNDLGKKGEGGRRDFIKSVRRVFIFFGQIASQIGAAWQQIFPPDALGGFVSFTHAFRALALQLHPTGETLENVKRTFAGVFAVLHIGFTIVKAFTSVFTGFFGAISGGAHESGSGLLEFLANIGDMLVEADKFISSGGKLVDLFHNIGEAAGTLAGAGLGIASDIIFGIINGLIGGGAYEQLKTSVINIGTSIIDWIKETLGIHSPSTVMAEVGTNIIEGLVVGIKAAIGTIFKIIGAITGGIFDGFKQLFGDMDALDFASVLNAIFAGALILTIRKFIGNIGKFSSSFSQMVDGVTNTLKTMQHTLQAQALVAIAIAVGILVVALVALQFIDPKKIGVGLGALATLMALLVGVFASMSKIGSSSAAGAAVGGGTTKITAMAGAMLVMANAVLILTGAVTVLAHQNPEKVARGLGFVSAMMAIMVGSIVTLAKLGGATEGAAGSILIMAIAMNVLITAVVALGLVPWQVVARGIGLMAASLAVMVAAVVGLSKIGPNAISGAGALLIVAGAMTVVAAAVLAFGTMNKKTLIQGMVAMAAGLVAMVGALTLLAGEGPLAAGAAGSILAMSVALLAMAKAIQIMGEMKFIDIVKGLGAMTVGLTLFLAAGLAAMFIGPGLLALGAAMALAGVGMLAFATGFAILAAVGAAGVAVAAAAFSAFIVLLPSFAAQIAAAFVQFIKVIAIAAPKIGKAVTKIIDAFFDVIIRAVPKIGELASTLIHEFLRVIRDAAGDLIDTGFYIIKKLIEGLADNAGAIAEKAVTLIEKLAKAIEAKDRITRVITAVWNLLMAVGKGIAKFAWNKITELVQAGKDMAGEIVKGLKQGLKDGIKDALSGIGSNVLSRIPGVNQLPGVGDKKDKDKDKIQTPGQRGPVQSSSQVQVSEAESLFNQMVANATSGISGLSSGTAANRTALSKTLANLARIQTGGNAGLIDYSRNAIRAQRDSDYTQAAADAAAQRADALDKAASKAKEKADKKKATKAQKRRSRQLTQQAAQAARAAEALDRAAAARQEAADRAAAELDYRVSLTTAEKAKDFKAAGDIASDRSKELAKQAAEKLAQANAQVAAARLLTGKARTAMLNLAQQNAAAAAQLAAASNAANEQAIADFGKALTQRFDAFKEMLDNNIWQEAFDKADTTTQAEMLRKRADEEKAKAAAAQAKADEQYALAQSLATTDVIAAAEAMDIAEQKAQEAKEASDAAKADAEQAAQLLGEINSPNGANATLTPSRSVLEDAASSVDRYTASLAAAQTAAGATVAPIQLVQNNYSPIALTASEIYRQNNNLVSNAQIKMGGTN